MPYYISFVIGFLLFVSILAYFIRWRSERFGTAKILRYHSMLRKRKKGLVIDGRKRISTKNSYQHCIICSPTGVGKTTTFTFPNLLNLNHSMVVTDVKGELYDLCAGYLEKKGFQVQVLDLENINQSVHFNPLKRLKTEDEIKAFCTALFNMSNDGAKTEGIWKMGSINLIEVIIRCLKNTPNEEYANFANVIHILNNIHFSDNAKRLEGFFTTYAPDEDTFAKWKAFLNNEDKIRAGHLAGALTVMSPFDTGSMKKLTNTDSIRFADLRERKQVFFMKVPVGKSKEFAPLLTLLYMQLFDYLLTDTIDESSESVFFLLEEFGNLLRINNFSNVVSLIRSKRVSLSIICQDIDQIDRIYGKSESETIVSNCGSQIVFPGIKSERTLRKLEMMLGVATNHEEDERGRTHVNPRKVMDAFEIRTMKENRGLYLYSNLPAIRLKMKPIYKNLSLLHKTGIRSKNGQLIPLHKPTPIPENPVGKAACIDLDKLNEKMRMPASSATVTESSKKQEKLEEMLRQVRGQ